MARVFSGRAKAEAWPGRSFLLKGTLLLSPLFLWVLGGGAADHAAPVLTALPLLAAAVLLLDYGKEPVLGQRQGLLCQAASSWGPQLREKWPLVCTLGGGL